MVAPLVVTNPCLSFGAVGLQYMNSFVSCSYPDLTWSPNLSAGNRCLVSTWLSIIIARICPSHHRRRPSQVQLLRVSPSTRNDVSTTGRVRHLNRVVFANSRTKAPVYSLSRIPTTTLTSPRCATGNGSTVSLTWRVGAPSTPPDLRPRAPDGFRCQPLLGHATSFRCSFKM
jgi:hypothetical protein